MDLTSPVVSSREVRDAIDCDGSATVDGFPFEYLHREKSNDFSSVVVDRYGGKDFSVSSNVYSSQDKLNEKEDRHDKSSAWDTKDDTPGTRNGNGTRPTDTGISSIEKPSDNVSKINSARMPEDHDVIITASQARNPTSGLGLEEHFHNDHLHHHWFNEPTKTPQEGRIPDQDPGIMEEKEENTSFDVFCSKVKVPEFYDLTDVEDHSQRRGISAEMQIGSIEEDPVSMNIMTTPVCTTTAQEIAPNYGGGTYAATIIRKLFKIKESVPYFVLLPYTLATSKDGQIRLEADEAANIATDFADCVLRAIADSRLAPSVCVFVSVLSGGVLLVGCGVKLGFRVP
mmetsp:Transcript_42332/g.102298  ORF Transcript_42332/g.102298 Transcript_42332/m.102298 type:complete len:342 (-) Transcript_42332:2302-3327(-)|eukprot:CAMPEP_0113641692 /NCGR_PEP_ID=MMETSP0017_2-20120614/21894_1 /TAXON_ID=2856 /ORGANISM="Cylindrotheca closterium" /LENGTH=341 /DNA_ID=CAMNT_0000553061 /DNA_START=1040 /DNA_END=2065 /DNA_ORIENTATION=- /assembly_acc=CAM_ASM_000147